MATGRLTQLHLELEISLLDRHGESQYHPAGLVAARSAVGTTDGVD